MCHGILLHRHDEETILHHHLTHELCHGTQELLAVSDERIDLVDVGSQTALSKHWVHSTHGLQLLPVPIGSMLLVLAHNGQSWSLEVLSVDSGHEQSLFETVKKPAQLPLLADQPQVKIASFCHLAQECNI